MLRQANRMEKALYGAINQFYVAFTDIYPQAAFAAKTCQVACVSFAQAIVGVKAGDSGSLSPKGREIEQWST